MSRLPVPRAGKRFPRLYKIPGRRAEWKKSDSGEAAFVVKGTSRRIIVVKSPDPQVFEEAIFVLREDWQKKRSAEQVVEEARRAAGAYLDKCGAPRSRASLRTRRGLPVALGVLALGAAWAVCRWLGLGF